MMRWTLSEIQKNGLGDFRLCSIAWSESGSDLSLVFDPPGTRTDQLVITLAWATEVNMEMKFGEYSGKPLVSEAYFDRKPGVDLYKVRIYFGGAPDGYVSLSCNEIHVTG
jgi:hypothetical protein